MNLIENKLIDIYNDKCLDYVIIFAAGNGKRLKPITNYIPKLLVTVNNNTLLFNIINYWKFYTNNIVIVINSKYYNIVNEYLKIMKFYNINFQIKIIDIIDEENSFTISKAITNEFYEKKILFTWCDIYPNEIIQKNVFNKNIIFTFGNECRYFAEKNFLKKTSNGNVIGIFYFDCYKGFDNWDVHKDLCDIYCCTYSKFEVYNLNNLIDIGDMDKLNFFIQNNEKRYKTRFFNCIIENENKLIKKSISYQGNEIIQNEINWYKNIKFDFIPEIFFFGNSEFIMQKIDAKPFYKYFWNYSFDKQEILLEKIFELFKKIHNNKIIIEKDIIKNDIEKEMKIKIFQRIDKIKSIITTFGIINYVNGVKIDNNIECLINNIYKNINNYYLEKNNYSIIHGDCQFSNILFDENENFFFIDPRGYFGDTKIYGICEYDYAKVAYSLTGYDIFNNDDKYFIKYLDNDKIELSIENHFFKYEKIFEKYCNLDIIKQIIIINWIGLSQYNENNILKCISCYYYGLYLNKVFF